MALSNYLKKVEKVLTDNSPTLLTVVGVTGVVATAYLASTATLKADRLIKEVETQTPTRLEPKEKVALVWKLYVPATASACVTAAAIIGANRIGNRRAAALAVAYTVSEKAFSEYREKIVEKIGPKREEEARVSLAQDKADKNPPSEIIIIGGDVLCHEAYTGRYFKGDLEKLRKAQNDINAQVLNSSYASLSDFYDLVGLPHTSNSDDIGWNSDKPLDLEFSAILVEGKPCMSIDFRTAPIRHFNRLS